MSDGPRDVDEGGFYLETDAFDNLGWMDDRWNEDEYEFGVIDTSGQGGMSRSAGEMMTTPHNHAEI